MITITDHALISVMIITGYTLSDHYQKERINKKLNINIRQVSSVKLL